MANACGWTRGIAVLAVAGLLGGCAGLPKLFHRGDGKVVTSESGTCSLLNPESKLHPVGACERAGTYEVIVGGSKWTHPKGKLRALYRERLLQFVRQTNYPWKALKSATVEFWLVAPLFEPEDAYFMTTVLSPAGNFTVRLALDPADWHMDGEAVAWLGGERYPSLRAKQAGLLRVTPRPEVTEPRFARFLAQSGAEELTTAGGSKALRSVDGTFPAVTLRTEPFAEQAVAQRLARHAQARAYLADVALVPAGDKEGWRAKVWQFAFFQE